MREIVARPLTADLFSSYGDVVEAPPTAGRAYFSTSVTNLRASAEPKIWMLTKQPSPPMPIEIATMERHEFSSQTFVPIDIGPWLIVVAPSAASGGPASESAEAFIAASTQGVSYRANVWHSGLHVFDKVARLTVAMWLDGSPTDEEIVKITPFLVRERR
jgi:ureidoglycolate lyase